MLMTTPTQENNDYASWATAMSLALEGGDGDGFRAARAGFDQARNAEVTLHVRRIATDLQSAKVSHDMAMLTGLVHGVGKLYILTHSMRHPALFGDQTMYQRIVRDWHGNIAKALLESWYLAEDIVTAVHSYEDSARELRGNCAAPAPLWPMYWKSPTCCRCARIRRNSFAPAWSTAKRPHIRGSMPISVRHWSASRPKNSRLYAMPWGISR